MDKVSIKRFNGASQLLLGFPQSVILFNIIGYKSRPRQIRRGDRSLQQSHYYQTDYAEAHNNMGNALNDQVS